MLKRHLGSFLAATLLLAASAAAQTATLTRSATTFTGVGNYAPTVAFGNGTFVALGLKATPPAAATTSVSAYTSPDGNTWTERVVALGGGGFANHGTIRFINGRFVFTGTTLDGGPRPYTATSADGATWSVATTQNSAQFADLVTGGGTSVGFFGTTLSSSTNGGSTWTSQAAAGVGAFDPYQALAYGAGRFVLLNSSRVWTSTDAATWTAVTGPQSSGRIAFGNGLFVLTGTALRTSTDGVTFTTRTPTGMTLAGTNTLRFAAGRFLYHQFTFSGITPVNQIIASADGITWTPFAAYPAGTAMNMNDVAEGNNRLVFVGFNQSQVPVAAFLDTTNLPSLPSAPAITAPPAAVNAIAGGSATFAVTATGTDNTYQWLKDGVVIAGATSATYTIASTTTASAGNYSVRIANSLGTVTSTPVTLTLVSASAAGRIINLSVLTSVGAGGDSFSMGYVVGGAGTSGAKPLVIRAAGPSLGALGVPGTLDDPKIELVGDNATIGSNDNWGGSAALADALASVGAFAYTGPTSRDAAVAMNVTTRNNSVKVSAGGAGTSTGAVIAEVYDATPGASYTAATPRLINVSVIKPIGDKLTAGFVIGGSTSKTVLIRAIGPTLNTAFGMSGVVADPQLTLFGAGAVKITDNDNWGGGAQLSAAFNAVGAFALPAASRDAAVLVTLPPGSYAVEVVGAAGATGTALVEVYDVP